MSKWVVDIHGDIEGDYEIIKKYEGPKTDVLDKVRAEIQGLRNCSCSCSDGIIDDVEDILDKYTADPEIEE